MIQIDRPYQCVLLFVFLLILGPPLCAQEDCANQLEKARRSYYNGNLREVGGIVNCLGQLTRADRIDAYVLLINSYLLLNEDEKGEDSMSDLLSFSAEYKLRSNELEEFIKLYHQFDIRTRYSIGFMSGVNIPSYQVMSYRSVGSRSEQPAGYQNQNGFILGINGAYAIFRDLYADVTLGIQSGSYSQEETILDYRKVSIQEHQVYLSLPIQLKYILTLGSYKPFIGAGMGINYLFSAKGDLDHIPLPSEYPVHLGFASSMDDYDIRKQRKNWTLYYVGSAGVQKNLGRWLAELRITYTWGLNNLVEEKLRFNDEILLKEYAYVPDDFKMDTYQLSLGLFRNFSIAKKKIP